MMGQVKEILTEIHPFNWEAIAFDSTCQTASKCNLCADLTEPRCLAYCPTAALTTDLPLDSENDFPPPSLYENALLLVSLPLDGRGRGGG